jgi:hypothetical protein
MSVLYVAGGTRRSEAASCPLYWLAAAAGFWINTWPSFCNSVTKPLQRPMTVGAKLPNGLCPASASGIKAIGAANEPDPSRWHVVSTAAPVSEQRNEGEFDGILRGPSRVGRDGEGKAAARFKDIRTALLIRHIQQLNGHPLQF